ncbi:MAG: hypothetical protein V7L01_28425 [Nostoc sp.]|uniref:hypothetical protein n=1 Tax=Nostoc sp. TaxID=1180 RepID=UPI002FF60E86
MIDAIDKKIQQANEQLKKKGTRVIIYRRDNRLWLRGTLPPKPHIQGKDKDYSQFVSLGNNAIASDKGIQYAATKARLLSAQLLAGTFKWEDWIDLDKIAPDRAAKFMGHSLSVHLQVYRAWFDESVYIADYQKAIANARNCYPTTVTPNPKLSNR